MFIRFFKKSYLSRLAFLVLFTTLWWIPGTLILQKPHTPSVNGILPLAPALSFLLSVFILLASAFIVNNIGSTCRLTDRNSLLIAFFFILVTSSSAYSTQLGTFLAATLFFTLFFQKIFNFHNSSNIITTAFDAGLFLGLSSLFYPPTILFVLFAWMALLIYQADQWRAYITIPVGIALPWFFLFSGFFFFDKLSVLWPWFLKYFHFRKMVNPFHTGMDLAMFILILTNTILAFLWSLNRLQRYKILLRQHTLVILWSVVFTILILFILNAPLPAYLLLSVPASLILGIFFSQIQKLRWAERFVLLWIIFVFVHQYLPLFHAS